MFGGTGFVGRRVVRHLRASGTKVRVVSRHREPSNDDGIKQIAADARDQRSVESAVAGADGVVNAISLYVEHGSDTFHSVHVETAAKIAAPRGRRGGIGAKTTSSSPYILSRSQGEAAVQTAFPARQSCLRPMMHFLLRFSGCCDPCQPMRYSATAERGFSRCTWTTWRQ